MTVVDAFQDRFELGCQWLQGPARECELVWSIKQTGLASGGRKLDAVCPITCVNESTTAILGCRLLQRQRRTRACVFDSFFLELRLRTAQPLRQPSGRLVPKVRMYRAS